MFKIEELKKIKLFVDTLSTICYILDKEIEKMKKDTGADPIGDGTFRMFPSGDIVDLDERNRRLPPVDMGASRKHLIMGLSTRQIMSMQGRPGQDLKD